MPRWAWNKTSAEAKRRYFELIRQGCSGTAASQQVGVSLSCGLPAGLHRHHRPARTRVRDVLGDHVDGFASERVPYR